MSGERRGTLDRIDAWAGDRAWLADLVMATALAALLLPGSLEVVRDDVPGQGWRPALVAAVAVLHVAVALRRRWPVPVLGVAAAVELLLALAPPLVDAQGERFPAVLLPSSLAYLVAAYTVSRYADHPWPAASLLVGSTGAGVTALRLGTAPGTAAGTGSSLSPPFLVATVLATVLAAWALGQFRRLRSVQIAALAERARAAELDREQRDRRAAADERARIARELHDVVAHSVSVMVRQAEAGRYVSAKDPAAATAALATIADIGREALTDMRSLLGVLREDGDPAEPAPQPTVDDVPDLLDRVRATGQRVRLRGTGDPRPLDRTGHLAAYRVVQEALTNVVKHAGESAETEVALTWTARHLRIRVTDTGPPARGSAAAPSGGGGLRGMRERVELTGGRLRYGPTGAGGFEVVAELPVAGGRRGAGRDGG